MCPLMGSKLLRVQAFFIAVDLKELKLISDFNHSTAQSRSLPLPYALTKPFAWWGSYCIMSIVVSSFKKQEIRTYLVCS